MGSFSIWHWLIVLLFVGGIGYAIVWSRRVPKVATADGGTGIAPPLTGLGGWLALFVIGQVLGLFRGLASLLETVRLYDKADPKLVNVEVAMMVALLAFSVYVTIALFRKWRSFPVLWIYQGLAVVLFYWLAALILSGMMNVSFAKFVDEAEIGRSIGTAIGVALWAWYLRVSVRVRNTFVN
ncbi:MAG: DUF2569 family protein [Alphaproteobacteria bacterium]|nr:DUF2569 family protein [Alphaproteobacteria bacterium]